MTADQETVAEIERVDAERVRAVLAKDAESLEQIFAAELCYVHSSGVDEDKSTYICNVVSGHYDYRMMRIVKREFRIYGDVVLVNGDTAIDMFSGGAPKKGIGRFLEVWVRRDKRWLLASWHTAPAPTA